MNYETAKNIATKCNEIIDGTKTVDLPVSSLSADNFPTTPAEFGEILGNRATMIVISRAILTRVTNVIEKEDARLAAKAQEARNKKFQDLIDAGVIDADGNPL